MGDKDENVKIGMMVEGEFKEIKPLETFTLNQTEEVRKYFECHNDFMSATFSCNYSQLLPQFEFIFGRTFFLRHCQTTKANNWLKRHGLPMRRKRYG